MPGLQVGWTVRLIITVRPFQKPGLRPSTGREGRCRRRRLPRWGFLNRSHICRCRAKEPEPAAQLAEGMGNGARKSCQRPEPTHSGPQRNESSLLHLGEAGRETKARAKTLSRIRAGSAKLVGLAWVSLFPRAPSRYPWAPRAG